MSEKSWENYTMAEIWAGYKKYGIWNPRNGQEYDPDLPYGLIGVQTDAPQWLKDRWEFEEQQRKDGIKV